MVKNEAIPLGLVGFPPERIEAEIRRSLALLEVLGGPRLLIDVGSGAGFPGVPLGIALGGITLIEPRRRAAAFLEKVNRELELNLEVVAQTAQEAVDGPLRERADAVTCRAVAPPGIALGLCSPLTRVGGLIVLTAEAGSQGPGIPPSVLDQLGVSSATTKSLGQTLEFQQRVHIMTKLRLSSLRESGPAGSERE